MTQPSPGWYPDPQDSARLRYWTGAAWSEHTAGASGAAAPARTSILPPAGDAGPSRAQAVHFGPMTWDGVPLASWEQRLGAWAIDAVAIAVLTVAIGGVLVGFAEADPFTLFVFTTLVSSAYAVPFWMHRGQTPGKMAVGISVRHEERPGPLDGFTCAKRRLLVLFVLLPFVNMFYPVVVVVDGVVAAISRDRMALHDQLARTVVVVGPQPRRGEAT